MKKIISLLLFSTLLILSCKKESNNNCFDNEYYFTFTENGKRVCFDFCLSELDSYNVNGSSKNSIKLEAGKIKSQNGDTINLSSLILITIPDTLTRKYNKDDTNSLNFSFSYSSETNSYFYPLSINEIGDENLQFTITELDSNRHFISGSFHGKIYNNNLSSFILIENGSFRSPFMDKNK